MKNRDQWVVDTDVARASGFSEHPISGNCRHFLEFIRGSGFKIIFNQELLTEWKEHRSIFSRKWLASMFASKRVIRIEDSYCFRSKIQSCPGLNEREKQVADKDCHLINASFNNGKSIASGDNNARNAFRKIASCYTDIYSILWVDPKLNALEIIEFLASGSDAREEWYINS